MKSRTRGTHTLAPSGDGGTLVTFTLEMVRKQNARAMERLKALMEARTPAAS